MKSICRSLFWSCFYPSRRHAILPLCLPARATPTVDPDIYNQVPTTTVYEAGQCTSCVEQSGRGLHLELHGIQYSG